RLRLAPECAESVLAQHGSAHAQLVEVLLDRARGGAVRLDEDDPLGAAGEGLEAHRTGAGEEVEHARALERADQVERGLPHAVARRARVDALRRDEARAPMRTGDDSHSSAS